MRVRLNQQRLLAFLAQSRLSQNLSDDSRTVDEQHPLNVDAAEYAYQGFAAFPASQTSERKP